MTYLHLNLYIIIIPLLLSFESRIRYFRFWPAVVISIISIGTLYVMWDAYVTKRGDWSFNQAHLSGRLIFGLPLEEILFFLTVPFSCIFIYEAYRYLVPAFGVPYSRLAYVLIAISIVTAAYLFRYQNYTRTVMSVTGGTVLLLAFLGESMLRSGHFWLAMATSFVPFIIFNGYLTAIPIVRYNPEAIVGIRIRTIPVEDFFYNYAMLASYYWMYIFAKSILSL